MDLIAPFTPEEEKKKKNCGLVRKFNLWCKVEKKPDADKADWYWLAIGSTVDSMLWLVEENATFTQQKDVLEIHLGEHCPQKTASHQLAALKKGHIS